jgi:hypothetical protein
MRPALRFGGNLRIFRVRCIRAIFKSPFGAMMQLFWFILLALSRHRWSQLFESLRRTTSFAQNGAFGPVLRGRCGATDDSPNCATLTSSLSCSVDARCTTWLTCFSLLGESAKSLVYYHQFRGAACWLCPLFGGKFVEFIQSATFLELVMFPTQSCWAVLVPATRAVH